MWASVLNKVCHFTLSINKNAINLCYVFTVPLVYIFHQRIVCLTATSAYTVFLQLIFKNIFPVRRITKKL